MIGGQDNRGSDHISRQWPTPYFVDASKKLNIGRGVQGFIGFDAVDGFID